MNTDLVSCVPPVAELDDLAAGISEDSLPKRFPDPVDIEQWLDSRASIVALLAERDTPDCGRVRRIWHEAQAMLIAMQVRHIRHAPDFSDVIAPLRRIIMNSEELAESTSPNPAAVSCEMFQQFGSLIRELHREFRVQTKDGLEELPRWCVFKRNAAPARRSSCDVWSLENGQLTEPLERWLSKLADARARNLGNVECESDEYEVALMLAGKGNSPLPEKSIVSLPAWYSACRANSERDERWVRILQSLQIVGVPK